MICEQINYLWLKTMLWPKKMMNNILVSNKFPKLWRNSKVCLITINQYHCCVTRPSCLNEWSWTAWTLLQSTLLLKSKHDLELKNRVQANCWTWHSIEDGYKKSITTGTVFMDLSPAYDTVNHRVLQTKLYGMTDDTEFIKFIGSMMSNRRFYAVLNGEKSR